MGTPFTLSTAYYPEQWDRALWPRDLDLMAEAGISAVRVAEFAWSRMEVEEGRFDFQWLRDFVALASIRGLKVILGTPTEAPPPWLWTAHPEILPVDHQGLTYGGGSRRHGCPNSPVFQHYSYRMVEAMGAAFGPEPAILGWQLDNEAGCHVNMRCYCPSCIDAFRAWLAERYGTPQALNDAWGTSFWSAEIRDFSQATLHRNNPTLTNPGYELAVSRFQSDSWIAFLARQAEILRRYSAAPITHNVTWYAEQIDCFQLGTHVDAAGIDIYQRNPALVTLIGDLSYSIKNKPFWVMEMGAEAQKMPRGDAAVGGSVADCTGSGRIAGSGSSGGGANGDGAADSSGAANRDLICGWASQKAAIVKHLMQGASLCSLFRWRSAPAGGEMETGLGGLTYHDGSPTPTWTALRDAAPLFGAIAARLSPDRRFQAAIILDYTDYFLIHSTPRGRREASSYNRIKTDYFHDLLAYHRALCELGVSCAFVPPDADLSPYGLVVACEKWTMDSALGVRLSEYASAGGILIGTDRFGVHTPEGRMSCVLLPGHAVDLFGVYFNEFFSPQDFGGHLRVRFVDSQAQPGSTSETAVGQTQPGQTAPGGFTLTRHAVPLESRGALFIARASGGSYDGKGIVSEYAYGTGWTYFVGGLPEEEAVRDLLDVIIGRAMRKSRETAKVHSVPSTASGSAVPAVPAGQSSMSRPAAFQPTGHQASAIATGRLAAVPAGQPVDIHTAPSRLSPDPHCAALNRLFRDHGAAGEAIARDGVLAVFNHGALVIDLPSPFPLEPLLGGVSADASEPQPRIRIPPMDCRVYIKLGSDPREPGSDPKLAPTPRSHP